MYYEDQGHYEFELNAQAQAESEMAAQAAEAEGQAEQEEVKHTPLPWTIEKHGNGWAMYSGRDNEHHGLNLIYLSSPDNNWIANRDFILEACNNYYSLKSQLQQLQEQNQKLQKFKDYVHDRLNKMGIPVDPDSPHKEAGCRIGGRLDIVQQLQEENERLNNDLLDALDLKEGKGPTALSNVVADRNKLQSEVKTLREAFTDLLEIVEFLNITHKFPENYKKFKALQSKVESGLDTKE